MCGGGGAAVFIAATDQDKRNVPKTKQLSSKYSFKLIKRVCLLCTHNYRLYFKHRAFFSYIHPIKTALLLEYAKPFGQKLSCSIYI